MTGKVMCKCELKDVKNGKQRKTCKRCDISSRRDMIIFIFHFAFGLFSIIYFRSMLSVIIPSITFTLIMQLKYCFEYNIRTYQYYTTYHVSQCNYCHVKPTRAMAKRLIRTFVWIEPISNFIIKWIK